MSVRKCQLAASALLALLVLAIPCLAAAQASKTGEGQKLFQQNCVQCHGVDGSANTPIGQAVGAVDLRSAAVQKLTDAQIYTQIDKGKGGMPPFGGPLDKAKINELVAYVRTFGKKTPVAKKPQ